LRRRVGVALGVAAGLIAVTIGQISYWYLPREQPAAPSPEARALLAADGWRRVVWIAHPHQNLARLQERVGDLRAWWEFVRGGEGGAANELPRFGPFLVPPATELVVAESEDEAILAWLRVRSSIAVLARAAGAVARNPWLAGGPVRLSSGRRGRVRWQDGFWILGVGSDATPAADPLNRGFEPPERRALAIVGLTGDLGRLPSGRYRLLRGATGLELRSGALFEPAATALEGGGSALAAWLLESPEAGDAAALLVWSEEGPLPPFPAAATLTRGAGRVRLPGVEMLRFAGREPNRALAGGFRVEGQGRPELARASQVAPTLDRMLEEQPDLRLWAGADLARLRSLTEELARRFEGLPLARLAGIDPSMAARILVSTEGCGVSFLERRSDPERLRWWICPGPTKPPAR
jgi:hypothetical protein